MQLTSIKEINRLSRLAVNNAAKDPDTASKLAQVGFTNTRLQELKNLNSIVEELHQSKSWRYNEGMRISEQINKDAEALKPIFKEHVLTARFAFRHQLALLQIFLPKKILSNKWEWIEQAHHFYTHIMPYADQLAPHGLSQEEVEQSKASVEALRSLREDRIRKKGEAEASTEQRNDAVRQLKQLLREFFVSARLALKDNPQKLEAFGIKVRSVQH